MELFDFFVIFVATFVGAYLAIDRICTCFERVASTKALGECYKNNPNLAEKSQKSSKNG